MPEPYQLSDAEKAKVKEWLLSKEAVRPCPVCGFNEWALADPLAQLPLYLHGGGFQIGGGYPVVVVVCGRCAYMRFHSAILIGVAPSDEELAQAKGAKNG